MSCETTVALIICCKHTMYYKLVFIILFQSILCLRWDLIVNQDTLIEQSRYNQETFTELFEFLI